MTFAIVNAGQELHAEDISKSGTLLRGISAMAKQENFGDVNAISRALGITLEEDTPPSYLGQSASRFVPTVIDAGLIREIIILRGNPQAIQIRIMPANSLCVQLSDIERTFNVKPKPVPVPVSVHHRGPQGTSFSTKYVDGGFTVFVIGDSSKVVAIGFIAGGERGCAGDFRLGYANRDDAEKFLRDSAGTK